jgi:rhomboid protease GluP
VEVAEAVVTLPAGRDQPSFVELLGRGQASLPTTATRRERARPRQLAGCIAQQATAARVTLLVVAFLVGVWLLETALSGQRHGTRTIGYLAFGALPNADIIGRGNPGEWWRFVSSGLLHDRSSPVHLAANSAALILVGSVVERLFGRLLLISTLVLGVVAGGITWMVASAEGLVAAPDYTVGISAGICALIGMMLVYSYRAGPSLDRVHALWMKTGGYLGVTLMLLIGVLVPNINNVAHAGGLACGAVLGLVPPVRISRRTPRLPARARILLSSVVVLSVVSIGFAGQNLVGRLTGHS